MCSGVTQSSKIATIPLFSIDCMDLRRECEDVQLAREQKKGLVRRVRIAVVRTVSAVGLGASMDFFATMHMQDGPPESLTVATHRPLIPPHRPNLPVPPCYDVLPLGLLALVGPYAPFGVSREHINARRYIHTGISRC